MVKEIRHNTAFLPGLTGVNIIKIKIIRGYNYIMKKVRVISLARDTPTGTPLHS